MDINAAIKTLNALAQNSRLEAFRLLVRHGEQGLAAGEIARQLGVPHNTLSSHLQLLQQAGLVESERKSRSVIYRVNFSGMRSLLSFLLEDCCQGEPRLCAGALDSLMPECC